MHAYCVTTLIHGGVIKNCYKNLLFVSALFFLVHSAAAGTEYSYYGAITPSSLINWRTNPDGTNSFPSLFTNFFAGEADEKGDVVRFSFILEDAYFAH